MRTTILCLLLLLAFSGYSHAGSKTSPGPSAKSTASNANPVLDGYEVLRCRFADGKIVVRKDQAVVVVSAGETLPKSEIRLIKIGNTQAVFEKRSSHGRELMLLEERDGHPVLRKLSNIAPGRNSLPSTQQPAVLPSVRKEKER